MKIVLAALMLVVLAGCGGSDDSEEPDPQPELKSNETASVAETCDAIFAREPGTAAQTPIRTLRVFSEEAAATLGEEFANDAETARVIVLTAANDGPQEIQLPIWDYLEMTTKAVKKQATAAAVQAINNAYDTILEQCVDAGSAAAIAVPNPAGTSETTCAYQLDPYAFTADAEVTNTGNVATDYRLTAVWNLTGGETIRASKTVKVAPGATKRVGIKQPTSASRIIAHQGYDIGEPCTATVTTIATINY